MVMSPGSSFGNRRFSIAALTAGLKGGNLEVAASRDRAGRVFMRKSVEGRADHVVGVRRASRLRDDVVHAERLEDGAHRATGDDAGTGWRCPEDDLAGAVAAVNVMMQGTTFTQRHADQTTLGGFR